MTILNDEVFPYKLVLRIITYATEEFIFFGITDQNLTIVAINHFYVSLCANPNLSGNVSCKKKRNFVIPVVASVAGISILLLSVAALCWGIKRKRQPGKTSKYLSKFFFYFSLLWP